VAPILSRRVLNRTLLLRQHLLGRVAMSPTAMVEHLVGLQAQTTLPPYVGLWARVRGFDHADLTALIESRALSRIVVMRGTIHLLSGPDVLEIRPLMQDMLNRQMSGTAFFKHTADLPREELERAGREVLAAEPTSSKDLGLALAERFPAHDAGHLANTVRVLLPLVQTPPRGVWTKGGGPAYVHAEDWLGSPLSATPDWPDLVRRYLRAFGPATAADVTTWCGRTGTAATLKQLGEELVTYRDGTGRTLFDVAGSPVADGEEDAPVRLLGQYDNIFLSHKDRSRILDDAHRSWWMGPNGVAGAAVLVDGFFEGLWRVQDGHVVTEMFRSLTRKETEALDAEVARLEDFLAS
jgi:hypothetical protein